jgi:hypothetical protein
VELRRGAPLTTKVSSELTKVSSELTKVNSELTKVSSELTKVSSELTKVSSELTKVSSELTKVSSELIFFSLSFSRSYSNISMNPRCRLLRGFKISAVAYCAYCHSQM